MFSTYSKKLLILVITSLSVLSIGTSHAQDATYYLQQIMLNTQSIKNTSTAIRQLTTTIQTNTTNILQKVDMLPVVLEQLGLFIAAWMDEDDSDVTANNLMPNFTELGDLLDKTMTDQMSMQAQLNTDLLAGVNKTNLPYANDLVYSSLFGTMFMSPDPRGKPPAINPQYNYIKNASGIMIPHSIPGRGWAGSDEDQAKYRTYYNTVMAVESYNAFLLSNQYIVGPKFNDLQKKLIEQATDSEKWFAEVASEKIGFVLRQLLIYQSQIFIMLTQLVQTQKQMVTAQAMTNAVLIASAQSNESFLLSRAQGVRT